MKSKFSEKSVVKLRYQHFKVAIEKLSQTNDSLSMLLRVHLISENILEELIKVIFEDKSDAILYLNIGYKQKLDLVRQFKLEENTPVLADYIVGSLRKLNSFRNKLAHNLDFKITNEHIYDLYTDPTYTINELNEHETYSNLKDYALIILPGMLPYYEEESGKICL